MDEEIQNLDEVNLQKWKHVVALLPYIFIPLIIGLAFMPFTLGYSMLMPMAFYNYGVIPFIVWLTLSICLSKKVEGRPFTWSCIFFLISLITVYITNMRIMDDVISGTLRGIIAGQSMMAVWIFVTVITSIFLSYYGLLKVFIYRKIKFNAELKRQKENIS